MYLAQSANWGHFPDRIGFLKLEVLVSEEVQYIFLIDSWTRLFCFQISKILSSSCGRKVYSPICSVYLNGQKTYLYRWKGQNSGSILLKNNHCSEARESYLWLIKADIVCSSQCLSLSINQSINQSLVLQNQFELLFTASSSSSLFTLGF